MDLDIVLQDSLIMKLSGLYSRKPFIACVSDAINWMGEKFSSSLLIYKTGSQVNIFLSALKMNIRIFAIYPEVTKFGQDHKLKNILYIDEKFPNLKKNLKFSTLAIKNGDKLSLPSNIDKLS